MPIDRAILVTADRGHILRSTANLASKPVNSWLAGNPLANCTLPREWRSVNALPPNDVIDVLAAAAPNHCVDGWSYLARSLSAFMAGDLHAARHLSYYAQLRAALCILASLGIGVFNGINFVVDANGAVVRVDPSRRRPNGAGRGTHATVWDLLEAWVSMPQTAKQFLQMTKISNTSLADCLDAIWTSASSTVVAKPLMEAWGIDLFRGRKDHDARNSSSYNPQAFEPLPDNADDRASFVRELWSLFEPVGAFRFDRMDRHLLRQVLWEHHQFLNGNAPKKSGAISQRYDDLAPTVKSIASKAFLVGDEEPNHPAIVLAAKSLILPSRPADMIARAAHLLRAATSFTTTNFNDANIKISGGDLRPWIDPIAASKGFWPPAVPLADVVDLWEDVKLGLEELDVSGKPQLASLYEWFRRPPIGLPVISEADRIAVWSFCP